MSLLSIIIGSVIRLIGNLCEESNINDDNDQDFIIISTKDEFRFKLPSFWNHRMSCISMEYWPFQMSILNMTSNEDFKRFFMKGYDNNFFNIGKFISSLVYGVSDESYNPCIVQIEEFIIDYHGYSTIRKNYSILFNSNTKNLVNVNSIKSKIICAKYLILMMNEMPYDIVNIGNYSRLVKWLFKKTHTPDNKSEEIFSPKGW